MESFTEWAVALGTSGQERISLGMSISGKLCHTVVVGCFLVATTPYAHAQSRPSLVAGSALPQVTATDQVSGTKQLLIAVSPVNERVVWASGTQGTWVRTTDGGTTWLTGRVPGADSLQFRDVHAESAESAWLLSIEKGHGRWAGVTTCGQWQRVHRPTAAVV